MNVDEGNILEMLQQKSLEQQLDMIGLLKSLSHTIDDHSSDHIDEFNTRFSTLQQETQETDKALLHELSLVEYSDITEQFLSKKGALQKEITHLLEVVVPKANSVKSLMASEINAVKIGRKALSGYKKSEDHQGKIVNKAS